ncbi:MAG TPA: family 16 glycoside hydrolase [Burkholderiales bacterium]|nr:family 16 glycoside hydrolase [Burkholderiales bacterium]
MTRRNEGLSRRSMLKMGLASLATSMLARGAPAAQPAELKLPDGTAAERWDFETKGIEGWTVVTGQWAVEDVPGAPSGSRALMQRAVRNTYNVIVAPSGPYSDVDVSMKFKPISGREDASGGIVFRYSAGKYYLIRANALEDNFRFYYYEGDRRMLASASVKAPALGQWHTVRAVIAGDHIQGWLDGALLLDYRDRRFGAGHVGLWTKADSVTAFDDLTIRGIAAAG